MAVLDIARMGNPVLAQRAAEVADPAAPEIRRLVSNMLETMEYGAGTGLAAPQVHVPLRVVIFYVEAARAVRENDSDRAGGETDQADGDGAVPLTVLINPEIEILDPTRVLGMEACLSLPDLAGEVPRAAAVRYRGLTLDGSAIEREARGFHARVVQHECDHLDGILYPQRMTDLRGLTFTSELERQARRVPVEV
jgi:peptide deformylase